MEEQYFYIYSAYNIIIIVIISLIVALMAVLLAILRRVYKTVLTIEKAAEEEKSISVLDIRTTQDEEMAHLYKPMEPCKEVANPGITINVTMEEHSRNSGYEQSEQSAEAEINEDVKTEGNSDYSDGDPNKESPSPELTENVKLEEKSASSRYGLSQAIAIEIIKEDVKPEEKVDISAGVHSKEIARTEMTGIIKPEDSDHEPCNVIAEIPEKLKPEEKSEKVKNEGKSGISEIVISEEKAEITEKTEVKVKVTEARKPEEKVDDPAAFKLPMIKIEEKKDSLDHELFMIKVTTDSSAHEFPDIKVVETAQ